MIQTRTIDSYHFGFSFNLAESQLRTLTGFFHHPEPARVSVLGGRTSVTTVMLDGIGPAVIKYYRRGGLMRFIVKSRYLKIGKTRAQREFEMLDTVGALGLNVPQPVAYAHRGPLFYQAWLVTRAIHQPLSLARLSLQDPKKIGDAMEAVIEQISLLVQNSILHVDLHPGNIVVDPTGKVYLLDFDRGGVYHGNRPKLKTHYLNRWQRAVRKHGLPEMLNDILRTGL